MEEGNGEGCTSSSTSEEGCCSPSSSHNHGFHEEGNDEDYCPSQEEGVAPSPLHNQGFHEEGNAEDDCPSQEEGKDEGCIADRDEEGDVRASFLQCLLM